ncbi:MAG: AAA family ATPase [Patescibacteria group bacterium]
MIFGHRRQLKVLSCLLRKDSLPHAILFTGPSKIGKKTIVLEIVRYLCHSPKINESFFDFLKRDCDCHNCDLIKSGRFPGVLKVERDEDFSIKKIREIREQIILSSVYPYKIVVLDNIEGLSREATGALLKMLEEPRGKTVFFLIAKFPHLLPRTILSRCEAIRFYPLSREDMKKFIEAEIGKNKLKVPSQEQSRILDFSMGRPGLTRELLLDKRLLIWYNLFLESVIGIKKSSLFERMMLAERLDKEREIDDFLFFYRVLFSRRFSDKKRSR